MERGRQIEISCKKKAEVSFFPLIVLFLCFSIKFQFLFESICFHLPAVELAELANVNLCNTSEILSDSKAEIGEQISELTESSIFASEPELSVKRRKIEIQTLEHPDAPSQTLKLPTRRITRKPVMLHFTS
jgi:hypothetical protein